MIVIIIINYGGKKYPSHTSRSSSDNKNRVRVVDDESSFTLQAGLEDGGLMSMHLLIQKWHYLSSNLPRMI